MAVCHGTLLPTLRPTPAGVPFSAPSPARLPAPAPCSLDDLWAHLDRISPKFSVQKPDGYVPLTPASLVGTPYFSPAPSFGHIIAVPPSAQQQQHGSQAFLSLPGGGFGGFGDATLAQPQQSGQQDDASPSSSDGGASSYQTGASQSSWAQWIAEQIAQAETPAATEGGGSATADTPYTGGSDYHSAASGGGGGSSDGYHSAVEGSSLLTEASLLRLGADFEDGQQRQQHLLTAADADAGSATLATLAGSAHGEWDPDVGAAAKASGRRQHGQAPDFGLATLSLRPPGGGAAAAAAAETSADAAAAASPGVMMATIRSQTFGFSARSDVAVTPGFKAAAAAAPRVAAQSQRSAASALAAAAASSSKPTAAPKAEVRPAAAAPPPLSANAAAASSLMAAAMPPFTVQKAQHVTPSRQLAGSRHVQGSPEATDATTRRLFGSPGPESSSEHQQQPTPVLRGATAMPHRQPYAAPDTTYPQPQALHNQRQKTCADAAVQTDLLGVQLAQLLAAAAAHAPPPSSAVHATGAASESPVALALRFSGDATAANSPLAAAAAAAAVSAAASTGGAPAASSSVSDSAQDLYATVFSSLAAAASKVGGSPGGFNFGVSPSSHYPQPATPASFFHAAVPPSQQQLPHLTQQPRLLVDSGDASAAASSPVSQLLTRNELPPTPSLIAGNNATLAKRLRVLQMVFEAARAQAANGAPALLG